MDCLRFPVECVVLIQAYSNERSLAAGSVEAKSSVAAFGLKSDSSSCADFGGLRMNDFGVLFIRQVQHQKWRIAEFVLKKLIISQLSDKALEE